MRERSVRRDFKYNSVCCKNMGSVLLVPSHRDLQRNRMIVYKVAQRVKTLAAKADDLSSSPGTHMIKRTSSLRLSCGFHAYHSMCAHRTKNVNLEPGMAAHTPLILALGMQRQADL